MNLARKAYELNMEKWKSIGNTEWSISATVIAAALLLMTITMAICIFKNKTKRTEAILQVIPLATIQRSSDIQVQVIFRVVVQKGKI